MLVSLDREQVELLTAVAAGRVHADPRYARPDREQDPDQPVLTRRATQRLKPLKRHGLVELAPEDQADRSGVRVYQLTSVGERMLADSRGEPGDSPSPQ